VIHENSSIVINSSLEKVYKVAETYPKFVDFYEIKTILENNNSTIIIQAGYRLFGLPIRWKGVGKKEECKSIKYIQSAGLLRGMHADWKFFEVNVNNTRVTIDTKIEKLPVIFRVLKSLISSRVKQITDGILNDLKRTVEKDG